MPNAIIRCRQCGRTYNVDPKDLDRTDIVYSCECGKEIEVDFFDHCPNCGVNIGFTSSGSAKEIYRQNVFLWSDLTLLNINMSKKSTFA